MEHYDILIIGAGAAGIAAAKAAHQAGCRSIALVDRRREPGGVLLQCMHRGFGSGLTGPEYTSRLLSDFPKEVVCLMNTTVLSVSKDQTAELSSPDFGRKQVCFCQLILATGCREIPIGALPIAGTRPKGIYTAGQMQEMMNLHGIIPEGPAAILGSGDLGLIMAKHLAEAGCQVTLIEKKIGCGGMARNQRCLKEFPIRLICGATVTEVWGEKQLEGICLSDGTCIPCRTLLIAVGLVPEREIIWNLQEPEWLHLCGNCRTVHPMVEGVTSEGKQAGLSAYEHTR